MNNGTKSTIIAVSLIATFIIAQCIYSSRVSNETKVTAMVTDVSKGGMDDIVISLQNVRGVHYISRSATRGMDIDELKAGLVNKKIDLTYIKPGLFSKMSAATDTRLIKSIALGDSVVYEGAF